MNNGSNSGSFKTAMFADCLANSKEIFQLIDQVFPIDSCRHYEVLPLKLDGSDLVLGMLDPAKEESLKFARSIANVFRYNLEIQLIDLQTHQIILANYPQNQAQSGRSRTDQNKTVVDVGSNSHPPLEGINPRRNIDAAPTIISESISPSTVEDGANLPELPADLDFLKDLDLTPKEKPTSAPVRPDSTATLFEIPPEFSRQKPAGNLDNKATLIAANPADLLAESAVEEDSEIDIDKAEAQISQLIAETLGKLPEEIVEPESSDFLPLLANQLSWARLLEKAFQHQTDHLQLTRYSDRGSVIASKDKLDLSALESIPLPIFCSLVDEIKRMARLPQNTSSHPRKVVLERFYEQERILLRLEFTAQQDIEEVKIQILRNKALERYEQQQLDRVSEQALQLAQQLEKTLRRIQACFDSAELTNLTELQTVHSRITHQLRLLDKQR